MIEPRRLEILLDVITSPSAARYLQKRAIEEHNRDQSKGKGNSEESSKQLEKIDQFAHSVEARAARQAAINPWAGQDTVIPDKVTLKTNAIEEEQIRKAVSGLGLVQIGFSVVGKVSTQLNVEYTNEDNQPLLDDEEKTMNNLLVKWLNKNHIDQIGESLYRTIPAEAGKETEKEKPALDAKGNLTPADPQALEALIQDEKQGFKNFLQTWNVRSTISERKYESTAEQAPASYKERASTSNEAAPKPIPTGEAPRSTEEPPVTPSQSNIGKNQL